MNLKTLIAAFAFILPNYSFGEEQNIKTEIRNSLQQNLEDLSAIARFTSNTPLGNNESLSEIDVSEIYCIYQISDNIMRNIERHIAKRDSELVEIYTSTKNNESHLSFARYRFLNRAETIRAVYDFSRTMDKVSQTHFPMLQACRVL